MRVVSIDHPFPHSQTDSLTHSLTLTYECHNICRSIGPRSTYYLSVHWFRPGKGGRPLGRGGSRLENLLQYHFCFLPPPSLLKTSRNGDRGIGGSNLICLPESLRLAYMWPVDSWIFCGHHPSVWMAGILMIV